MVSELSNHFVLELIKVCINNALLFLKPYLVTNLTDRQRERVLSCIFFPFDFPKDLKHNTVQVFCNVFNLTSQNFLYLFNKKKKKKNCSARKLPINRKHTYFISRPAREKCNQVVHKTKSVTLRNLH